MNEKNGCSALNRFSKWAAPQIEITLERRAGKQLPALEGVDALCPPELEGHFIEWLEDRLAPKIKKNSMRVYRSELASLFALRPDFAARIRAASSENCYRPGPGRSPDNLTSSQRLRGLSDEDFEAIHDLCADRLRLYDVMITLFLECGRMVGLRPCEWPGVKLIQHPGARQGYALVVKNAKNSMGRAHGDTRTLLITNLEDLELAQLQEMVDRTGPRAEFWERLMKGCQDRLYELTRKLWPKRNKQVTLYSARHQFAADLKIHRPRFSLAEIAAMMGHASIATANKDYAKWHGGRRGKPPFRVMPWHEDVERVIELNKDRPRDQFENPFATPRPRVSLDGTTPRLRAGQSPRLRPK